MDYVKIRLGLGDWGPVLFESKQTVVKEISIGEMEYSSWDLIDQRLHIYWRENWIIYDIDVVLFS